MGSYISSGTSKFGSFTIENIAGKSTMRYRLYINGKEKWTTLLVEPKPASGSGAGGSFWDRFKLV